MVILYRDEKNKVIKLKNEKSHSNFLIKLRHFKVLD